MIADSTKGKGFGGLQKYLLFGSVGVPNPDRVLWTATRNLASDDPNLAALQMRATAAQAPRVEKPVYHLSLSAAPGERLSRETWEKVADGLLTHLGLEDHQVLIVAHDDTAHHHIHLMINRVHPERLRAWRDSWSKLRIQQYLRRIEREMGLREVPGTLAHLPGQTPPRRDQTVSSGEYRKALREAKPPTVERWRKLLRGDLLEASSWADLEARLARHGLRLKARGRGLVVTDSQVQIKISRLHRRASIHALEKRFGVRYRTWRDDLWRLEKGLEGITDRLTQRDRLLQDHSRLTAQIRSAEASGVGRLPQATTDIRRLHRRLRRLARRIDDLTEGLQERAADQRLATLARSLGLKALSRLLPPPAGRALMLVTRVADVTRRVARSR